MAPPPRRSVFVFQNVDVQEQIQEMRRYEQEMKDRALAESIQREELTGNADDGEEAIEAPAIPQVPRVASVDVLDEASDEVVVEAPEEAAIVEALYQAIVDELVEPPVEATVEAHVEAPVAAPSPARSPTGNETRRNQRNSVVIDLTDDSPPGPIRNPRGRRVPTTRATQQSHPYLVTVASTSERSTIDIEAMSPNDSNQPSTSRGIAHSPIRAGTPVTTWGDCLMCFESPIEPQGCNRCHQILGCKTCVESWHQSSGCPSCPLCRRRWQRKPDVSRMDLVAKRQKRQNARRSRQAHHSLSVPVVAE